MPRVFLDDQVIDRLASLSMLDGAVAFSSTKDENGEVYLSEEVCEVINAAAERFQVSFSDAVTMLLDMKVPNE